MRDALADLVEPVAAALESVRVDVSEVSTAAAHGTASALTVDSEGERMRRVTSTAAPPSSTPPTASS